MTTRYVYFIRPVGLDGPVKIGCSEAPKRRLASLMSWSPLELELVAAVPGGFDLERNIHECFSDLHSHREWFKASPRLTAALLKIASGVPVESAIDLTKRSGPVLRKPCGGSAWSARTRQKMSVLHRIRGAVGKLGLDNYFMAPTHILALISVAEERQLTRAEEGALDAFTDNPEWHREECLAAYRAWLAGRDVAVGKAA